MASILDRPASAFGPAEATYDEAGPEAFLARQMQKERQGRVREPHMTVDLLRQARNLPGVSTLAGLNDRFTAAHPDIAAMGEEAARMVLPASPTEAALDLVGGPFGKVGTKVGLGLAGASLAGDAESSPLTRLLREGKIAGKGAAREGRSLASILPEVPKPDTSLFNPDRVAELPAAQVAVPPGYKGEKTAPKAKMFDLLREHGGDVTKAKEALALHAQTVPQSQKATYTKLLNADIPPAVVRREMMTEASHPVVLERRESLRDPTYLKPDEALKVGDVAVPIAGDTSRAGVDVHRAGIDLENPVEMQGGHDYGLANQNPWASELPAARSKQENFDLASMNYPGSDIIGLHVAMSPEGSHFAKHTGDLWREMQRSGPQIDPAHVSAFDADVMRQLEASLTGLRKTGKDSPNLVRALREWKGVQHGGLDEALNTNPELRKAMLKTAAKPGWQDVGFPDIDRLYSASLDPSLKTGDVGGAVMRASPGSPLIPGEHRTYAWDIPGERKGQLITPLPPELVFPDTMSKFPNRAQALGSLRSSHTMRKVDQQMIDELSKYSENQMNALKLGGQ